MGRPFGKGFYLHRCRVLQRWPNPPNPSLRQEPPFNETGHGRKTGLQLTTSFFSDGYTSPVSELKQKDAIPAITFLGAFPNVRKVAVG